MNPARLKAYTYLIIVSLIWGVAGPVIKLTLTDIPWDMLLLYRFLISAIISLPFTKFTEIIKIKKAKLVLATFSYLLLNTTISFAFLFSGAGKTSLISMSLLSLLSPLMTIFAGYYFLKDKVTSKEKLGILITFLGSILILIEPILNSDGIHGELLGNLLIVASLIAGTASSILLKKLLSAGIDAVFLANSNFILGFFAFIPIVLFLHPVSDITSIYSGISLNFHLGVWYLAIFSGTIAYALMNLAQKSIEVSELAVFGYLYPIISAILAVVILKENMTLVSVFGAILTVIGIIIAEVKKRRYNQQ